MSSESLQVGVVLGGVAPEHEVSVITALQAAAALDRDHYTPVPIYVAKDGTWYTGDALLEVESYRNLDALREEALPVALAPTPHGSLELLEDRGPGALKHLQRPALRRRIDVMLLGLHGGPGENGGVQGLCEAFNVPYTSAGVFGSALGMDKVMSKRVCRQAGIPVVDFVALREGEWAYQEGAALDDCEAALDYPLVVKPARCGSSIGISQVETRAGLDAAIEDAFRYDDKVVVEEAVEALREINCSVLGDGHEATPSVLEEPVPSEDDEVLTFQDKYMREDGEATKAGGTKSTESGPEGMAAQDRIVPANLSDERTEAIQEMAVRIFHQFECAGVVRIDFMIDESTGRLYFNEINTIPGSFSFYLWEPSGVSFDELVDRLVTIARRRHRDQNGRVQTYDVNLLAEKSLQGFKASESS
ncbi:D-alanine--D-alanine ligase family protein [Salinibacter grassmerensis]|uniref:D-alanine--D-alanine ligase family protein n=1 Tax=Salinibacter grassmerensis TaxID=3040353 RepID=UPI0021E7ABD8|nr:D-alanine--D-alanine ligase family protein [Salinibacter grassmerensis]